MACGDESVNAYSTTHYVFVNFVHKWVPTNICESHVCFLNGEKGNLVELVFVEEVRFTAEKRGDYVLIRIWPLNQS